MFAKLIDELKGALKKKSTQVAITDMTNHARAFSQAVDNYVKKLQDPAKRPPMTTIATIMIPLIIPVSATPGGSVDAVNAQKSAVSYASAISAYAAAIVISPQPVMLMLGGILLPPGIVTTAKLVDLGIMTSIQNDFKAIFMEKAEGEEEIIMTIKATKMANAIKKAFTTKTNVIISGIDSTLPPPAGIGPQSFSITGPLQEK
jgi:hypothetical protein